MTAQQAVSNSHLPKGDLSLRWVTEELEKDKYINSEQATELLVQAKNTEIHPLDFIASQKLMGGPSQNWALDIDKLVAWLARKAGLSVFHFDPLKMDWASLTEVMSYAFAKRHGILAVEADASRVTIATAQPFNQAWLSDLSAVTRKEIDLVVVSPGDIQQYQIEFYQLSKSVTGATKDDKLGVHKTGNFEQLLELGKRDNVDANDSHVVNIVDWLLQYAFEQRASDIHIEPRRQISRVRFRIDGILHQVYELPAKVAAAVTSRIKVIGRMDLAERRKPQDGRIKTKLPNEKEVELRLSTLPTAFGEKMVMRIFDPEVLVRGYRELGLSGEDQVRWNTMTALNAGIVLVTGPTGSGKTTTLYSTLKGLATSEVNVSTVEDPIEMVEIEFNQMQVQHDIGLGFSQGMKALLRQDPDIIMVGEIRDLPTAEMAVQASLTGHLVISTLHTNDAPTAITRLLDLGVPSYLISSTLVGVMAQRLVRTLCPHCKTQVDVDKTVWDEMLKPRRATPPAKTFKAVGCLECRNTGYLGRQGIYEIIPVSKEIKRLINQEASATEIREEAVKEGTHLLRWSGAQKVLAGLTTIEEVMRVAPNFDSDA
ncbi:MAG: type II secretion system protein E [Kangiellaceae bacterium]|nr:type II secretion system protein E [Kangiellaceae bacterium]|tara:strand:- start:8049 stop:9839 length:1791 start_codon:yes stop_codon:yes gene_type:complete